MEQNTPPPRRWASKRQAAEYIGVQGPHVINELIKSGQIGCYAINQRVHRVDLNEIDAALKPVGQAAAS